MVSLLPVGSCTTIGDSLSIFSIVVAANIALTEQQLAPVSIKVDTATPVTHAGKYNNKFPFKIITYTFSVISLEG